MLRLGKFPAALLREREVEIPHCLLLVDCEQVITVTLSRAPLSIPFEERVQALHHQETLNCSRLDLPCRLASASCQHHVFTAGNPQFLGEPQGKQHHVQGECLACPVNHTNCSTAVKGYSIH